MFVIVIQGRHICKYCVGMMDVTLCDENNDAKSTRLAGIVYLSSRNEM